MPAGRSSSFRPGPSPGISFRLALAALALAAFAPSRHRRRASARRHPPPSATSSMLSRAVATTRPMRFVMVSGSESTATSGPACRGRRCPTPEPVMLQSEPTGPPGSGAFTIAGTPAAGNHSISPSSSGSSQLRRRAGHFGGDRHRNDVVVCARSPLVEHERATAFQVGLRREVDRAAALDAAFTEGSAEAVGDRAA